MVQSQYCLSWDSFKSNFTTGFSTLQQNGEFVDMTLAADGCYVKVHQVVMALASPYIKELLTSAPCQHPVLFLNNISSKILALLLEYIYTGEALVPADSLQSFTEAAKSLHINGLENLTGTEHISVKLSGLPKMQNEEQCHISGIKTLPVNDEIQNTRVPTIAQKISIKGEPAQRSLKTSQYQMQLSNVSRNVTEDSEDFPMDDSIRDYSDDECAPNVNTSTEQTVTNVNEDISKMTSSNLQFSVSIRGSLQMILNRYIYNLHSSSLRTSVRRWRCVDYRNRKCMAVVVTKGSIVVSRANLHNHSFHDKKIIAKIEKKSVFSAIDDVQWYKEKEHEEKGSDSDFIPLNDFTDLSNK